MLEVACDRAKSVIIDQLFFSLDAERFKAFNALLDAPLAANSGLERLMAIQPPWGDQVWAPIRSAQRLGGGQGAPWNCRNTSIS
jgi:hypothetical protein